MSAESVAYSTLSGSGAVTALVSTRIYQDFVPKVQTLPAIAIDRAGTEYITTIHSDVPLGAKVTLEFWCMASTRKGAEDLADAVLPVIAAARFGVIERTREFDAESEVFAAVLTAIYLE